MEITIYISFLFLSIYFILIMFYVWGWIKLNVFNYTKDFNPVQVSIVIACRNEEQNIGKLLTSLLNQEYPKDKIEIILVNDHSDDNTTNIINGFIQENQNIKLFILPEDLIGKKDAMTFGVKNACSELILTTDADCNAGPLWISSMVSYYLQYRPKLLSGPVLMENKTLFQQLQTLEFASLVGSGAGAVGINKAIMVNGANLLFEKLNYLNSNKL